MGRISNKYLKIYKSYIEYATFKIKEKFFKASENVNTLFLYFFGVSIKKSMIFEWRTTQQIHQCKLTKLMNAQQYISFETQRQ